MAEAKAEDPLGWLGASLGAAQDDCESQAEKRDTPRTKPPNAPAVDRFKRRISILNHDAGGREGEAQFRFGDGVDFFLGFTSVLGFVLQHMNRQGVVEGLTLNDGALAFRAFRGDKNPCRGTAQTRCLLQKRRPSSIPFWHKWR